MQKRLRLWLKIGSSGRSLGALWELVAVAHITPAPPEGAHRRTCGKAKEYPPAVWRRGADGNNMFALTFGQQEIPLIVSRDLVIWP